MNKHELVGKEESVLKTIEDKYRIVSRDGKPFIITCDFNLDRLNIKIMKGIITEIYYG